MFKVDFYSEFQHVTYVTEADNREEAKENAWAKFQQDEMCWAKTPDEMFDLIEVKEMP